MSDKETVSASEERDEAKRLAFGLRCIYASRSQLTNGLSALHLGVDSMQTILDTAALLDRIGTVSQSRPMHDNTAKVTVQDSRYVPESAAPSSEERDALSRFTQWWQEQDKTAFKGPRYEDVGEEIGVVHSWCKAAFLAAGTVSSIAPIRRWRCFSTPSGGAEMREHPEGAYVLHSDLPSASGEQKK